MAFAISRFTRRFSVLCQISCIELTMPKGGGGGFYAVRRGTVPGIYNTWAECQEQTTGFSGARFKKFPTHAEAQAFIDGNDGSSVSSSTSNTGTQRSAQKVANTNAAPTAGTGLSADDVIQLKNMSTRLIESVAVVGENLSDGNNMIRLLRVKSSDITGKTKESLQSFDDMFLKAQNQFHMLESLVGKCSGFVKELSGPGSKRLMENQGQSDGVGSKKPRKTQLISPEEASGTGVGQTGQILEVYTDGCCHNNGKSNPCAGIGIYWGPQHSYNTAQRLKGRQTNNRAEIHAARKAIHQAKLQGSTEIKVNTDSQFLINCITKWVKKWKKNGWKLSNGNDVINRKDIEQLEKTMDGIQVEWNHVSAHVGIPGNEAADKLANEGARKPYLYNRPGASIPEGLDDDDDDDDDWIL